jgi:hypothetical protein
MTTNYRKLALECGEEATKIVHARDGWTSQDWSVELVRLAVERDRQERGEPVAWMQSDHLSKLRNKDCGSDSMLARCSNHQLMDDYQPLYLAPPAEPEGWQLPDDAIVTCWLYYADDQQHYPTITIRLPPNHWKTRDRIASLLAAAQKKGE